MPHLVSESSPYLQQHAGNPVDWYPWSDASRISRYRTRSAIPPATGAIIAHSTFEDEATAVLINAILHHQG